MTEGQLIETKIAAITEWSERRSRKNFVLSKAGVFENATSPSRQNDTKDDTKILLFGYQHGHLEVTAILDLEKVSHVWNYIISLCIRGHSRSFAELGIELRKTDIAGIFMQFTLSNGQRQSSDFLPVQQDLPADILRFATAKPKSVRCKCGCNSIGHIASITAVFVAQLYRDVAALDQFKADSSRFRKIPFKDFFNSKLGSNPSSIMLHTARLEHALHSQRNQYRTLYDRVKALEGEKEQHALTQVVPRKRARVGDLEDGNCATATLNAEETLKDIEIAELKSLLEKAESKGKANEEKAANERTQLLNQIRDLKLDVASKEATISANDQMMEAKQTELEAREKVIHGLRKDIDYKDTMLLEQNKSLSEEVAVIDAEVYATAEQNHKISELNENIVQSTSSKTNSTPSNDGSGATTALAEVIAEKQISLKQLRVKLGASQAQAKSLLQKNERLEAENERLESENKRLESDNNNSKKRNDLLQTQNYRHIQQRRDCHCGIFKRRRVSQEGDYDEH